VTLMIARFLYGSEGWCGYKPLRPTGGQCSRTIGHETGSSFSR